MSDSFRGRRVFPAAVAACVAVWGVLLGGPRVVTGASAAPVDTMSSPSASVPADTTAHAPADTTAHATADTLRAAPAPPDTGATVPGFQVPPRGRTTEKEREIKATLDRMSRREVVGEKAWQRHKSGKVAVLSSALLPGLGQVYDGRRIKVLAMVGFASYYSAQIWLNHKRSQRAIALRDRLPQGTSDWILQNRLGAYWEEEARTWVWWTGAVWFIGILDAWTDSHLYDIRTYTPPAVEQGSGVSAVIPSPRPTRYVTMTIGFD